MYVSLYVLLLGTKMSHTFFICIYEKESCWILLAASVLAKWNTQKKKKKVTQNVHHVSIFLSFYLFFCLCLFSVLSDSYGFRLLIGKRQNTVHGHFAQQRDGARAWWSNSMGAAVNSGVGRFLQLNWNYSEFRIESSIDTTHHWCITNNEKFHYLVAFFTVFIWLPAVNFYEVNARVYAEWVCARAYVYVCVCASYVC